MDLIKLDGQNLRQLLSAGKGIFELQSVDELRREVIVLLERALNAEKSTFFLAKGTSFRLDTYHVVARGVEKKFLNLYRRYYHSLDPFTRKLRFCKAEVLTNEEALPARQSLQSEYYHDFLKPQAIHHQLTIHLRSGRQWIGGVSVFRSEKAGAFSPLEKACAYILSPFIKGALEKNLAFERTATRERIIDAIAGELPYWGVVALNESLTAIYQDTQAEAMLEQLRGPASDPQRPLEGLPRNIYRSCRELMNEALEAGSVPPARLARNRMTLEVGRQRVGLQLQIIRDHNLRPIMILFLEPAEKVRPLNQLLGEQGLTPREIQLVHHLARGFKNADIADALCISEYTVDNHLKSIYRKLGVNNRTRVVYRLVELSAGMNPFDTPGRDALIP